MKYPAPLLRSLHSGVEHFWALRWWKEEVLATNNTPVTKSLASCRCSFCLCHCPDCRKSLLKGSVWELLCGQIPSTADCLASELHREEITPEESEERDDRPLASLGLWFAASVCLDKCANSLTEERPLCKRRLSGSGGPGARRNPSIHCDSQSQGPMTPAESMNGKTGKKTQHLFPLLASRPLPPFPQCQPVTK